MKELESLAKVWQRSDEGVGAVTKVVLFVGIVAWVGSNGALDRFRSRKGKADGEGLPGGHDVESESVGMKSVV